MVFLVGDRQPKEFHTLLSGVGRFKNELALALNGFPGEEARPQIGSSEEDRDALPDGKRDATSLKLLPVGDLVNQDAVCFLAETRRFRNPDHPDRARRSAANSQDRRAYDHVLGLFQLVLAIGLRPAEDARLNGDAFLVIGLKGATELVAAGGKSISERLNLQRLRSGGTGRQRRQKRKRRKGLDAVHTQASLVCDCDLDGIAIGAGRWPDRGRHAGVNRDGLPTAGSRSRGGRGPAPRDGSGRVRKKGVLKRAAPAR